MTERKTTGASKLIEIIKEVYDTKKRMKETINKFLETESDDFEEYATLTHNVLTKQYNTGYKNGYLDGWHMIFESATVPESQYSDGYREYVTFTPSIPQYSTDTNIDNLVDIMKDNYRCRVLLKGELNTSSDEFVIYPDLLEEQAETTYQDGYDTGFEDGYNDAVDFSYTPPYIYQSAWGETVTIVNNAGFGELYYWVDDYSTNKIHYTGPFTIDHTCTIHAFMQYNDHVSQVTTKICFLYSATEFGFEILEDVSFPGENKLWIGKGAYGTVKPFNEPNILYRINLGEWTDTGVSYSIYSGGIKDIFIDIDSLSRGDVIQFKVNKDYVSSDGAGGDFAPVILDEDGTRKGRDIKFNVFGNVFSLLTTEPFNTTKWDWSLYTNKSDYAANIRIVPERSSSPQYGDGLLSALHLVLPTAGKNSYWRMFWGQVNLTQVPLLPATTLANNCYQSMFEGCTSLTTAPELPATTLASGCYGNMFSGCTSLTAMPILPATTLAQYCYGQMFMGCTSLANVFPLNGDLSNRDTNRACYNRMFEGCTSLTTAPEITSTEMNAYFGQPYLAPCYRMFYGCSNLSSIKCICDGIGSSAGQMYTEWFGDWLSGVSSTGTFTKAAGVTWPSGDSGIPTGWTVVNAA